MRRRSFLLASLALAACTAISGAGDLEVTDDDAGTTATSSASSSSGTSSSSASSSASSSGTSTSSSSSSSSTSSSSSASSSGGIQPVSLIAEHFDASCNGWATVNAITDWSGDVGHDKLGACLVCAVADGDVFIVKTAVAPRAGKSVAEMYASRLPGLETPTSANVLLDISGADSNVSSNIGASFTLVKNALLGGTSTANGVTVTLKVGKQGAKSGDCMVIDDIVATLN